MKEIPILYSTPMIKAKLAGTKTQTRRIIDPQPEYPNTFGMSPIWGYGVPVGLKNSPRKHWPVGHAYKGASSKPWESFGVHCATNVNGKRVDKWISCPYGKPGDVLWARETWSKIHYEGIDEHPTYFFKADDNDGLKRIWKPSIHMPKAAARIWDRVVSIRVERLQDITEEDAMAEGINRQFFYDRGISTPESMEEFTAKGMYKIGYQILWNEINGQGSWDKNEWVWVVTTENLSTTGKPENL